MNTTKKHLVISTSKACHIRQDDCEAVIEQFFNQVTQGLERGQRIELRGFGTFFRKKRKGRPARNPRTGEAVIIPDSMTAMLRYSPEIYPKRKGINQ